LHYKQNKVSNLTLFERAGISQQGALPELRFISQPKGIPVSNTLDYVWIEGGGQDVNVYVIDTGAYTGNSEFYNMPGGKGWLTPELTDFPLQLTETDEIGHGSCVISKIAGPRYGVAKNTNITVVKLAINPQTGDLTGSSVLESLSLIWKDVIKNSLQGKAVVNMSGGLVLNKAYNEHHEFINTLRALIYILLEDDVVVVVSSGNNRVSNLSILCRWFSSSAHNDKLI
jgi:subtilisin family serine protease